MKKTSFILSFVVGVISLLSIVTQAQPVQKFAHLGDFRLESGKKQYDWASQLRAMIAQNISKTFNDDMEKAAGAVKAKVLIIVSKQDHMVNPHPALDFSKLIKARILELNSDCGHLGTDCEIGKVDESVNKFLSE